MLDILSLQAKLIAAALPSGTEQNQAELLRELARPFADEIFTDTLGNVICHKKGTGKKLMLAAHMDVIGLMIIHVDERGFLRFEPMGGHSPARLIGTTVRLENGVRGSVWQDAEAGVASKPLSGIDVHDLFIDIGASSREEAEKLAPIGSVAVFDAPAAALEGGRMMTPYADDLTGCAALLIAMEEMKQSENDVYFVFTVQEEVGCRGAVPATWRIEPYMGISVDVTGTGDAPSAVDGRRMRVRLGGGPAVKLKDGGMQANPQVVEHLRRAAKKAGFAVQDEILLGGSTDAKSMQRSKNGVLSGCVSIPCRNIHSPAEIVDLEDVRQAGILLARAAELPL